MGKVTDQVVSVAMSTAAAMIGAKCSELTGPTALVAALTQFGAAINAGGFFSQVADAQADVIASAAERIQNFGTGTELSLRQLEMVAALVRTTTQTLDTEKLAYLRECLVNVCLDSNLNNEEVAVRLIRDITTKEIAFLVATIKFGHITSSEQKAKEQGWYYIKDEDDSALATGLASLGLLFRRDAIYEWYRFTPIAHQLVQMVTQRY
ncbi:hypothetical protein OL229_09245 [Neisseriaceae bacterium JH1-16]|nr:hypothetical protein [Neisseriaceae bacterium JH1-16]